MQLLDLYVLVLRIGGVSLAVYGIQLFTGFSVASSLSDWVTWALMVVPVATAAFVFLMFPSGVARWLAREDGENTLTLGLGADDLQSVLLFAIGFYVIVVSVPALVAALILLPLYGSRFLWELGVRPAIQIIAGALILTRRRWMPGLSRAIEAWRKSRAD